MVKRFLILVVLLGSSLGFAGAPGIVTNGARDKPRIALTFDADMTPGMKGFLVSGKVKSYNNTKIYALLEQYQIKATFFLTGMWMELYPDQVKAFIKNPRYELENHSYSHPGFLQPCYGLPGVAEKNKISQVTKTKMLLEKYGIKNRYFRFPGGCASKSDVALVNKLGLEVVHWDVIGADGGAVNANVIVQNVLNHVKNGSIIVLHSHGGPKVRFTDSALKTIIPSLLKRGFQFVKLEELLGNH